jgi:hypothetical protein
LLVQDIQNDFTIHVYEQNTYYAMKHADFLQFNECITQLLFFYKSGKSDNKIKIFMCRILQFGFNGMTAELHKFLQESCLPVLGDQPIRKALEIIEAVNCNNYHRILDNYSNCEDEYVRFMIGMFLHKIRVWMLRILADR